MTHAGAEIEGKGRARGFSFRTLPPPLPAWQQFKQMHEGPRDSSLLREFDQTRQEILRLREQHASWVRLTRMT